MIVALVAAPALRADVLEMQNGDRYSGKVISVSPDTVVLNNDVLGKITVPRNKVVSLSFGTNAIAPKMAATPAQPVSTNLPAITAPARCGGHQCGSVRRVPAVGREHEFCRADPPANARRNPEATRKYDEMVSGLLSGQLNVNDLRQQAQTAAAQLREMKRELGPGSR